MLSLNLFRDTVKASGRLGNNRYGIYNYFLSQQDELPAGKEENAVF
jgi:hypothetical protein